jgi:hypothetical protein
VPDGVPDGTRLGAQRGPNRVSDGGLMECLMGPDGVPDGLNGVADGRIIYF